MSRAMLSLVALTVVGVFFHLWIAGGAECFAEPLYLTSPGETLDTDGDGMLDCWEDRYFCRRTDPGS